ncbi:M14 family metallopeptidase [Gilvimarinus sp. F26214L]|uniref:M14 family metallopeptidase n=1 Tax=Gilvimarinus sp. DZF01 TaxID=3461371 RepID=UPI0040465D53
MNDVPHYPIGTPGIPWGDQEKRKWLSQQRIQRSYDEDVVHKLNALAADCDIDHYGELRYDHVGYAKDRYPLYVARNRSWDVAKPTILITGGVHGYETSGVHGALHFLETQLTTYTSAFNFIVAPCVSPWGYETINRWNPETIDPNRSFKNGGLSQESKALIRYLADSNIEIHAHFDLHETTDTDNSEFRPALAARDGLTDQEAWDIPDGFYLVGNSQKPADEFQRAIIESVSQVTHIAPADANGKIIGAPVTQTGVINYDLKPLGLCAGLTDAAYTTTTEVYPDSQQVTDEQCIRAQVAAVKGGLDFIIRPR